MRRLYNIHPDEELFVSFQSREPLLPDAGAAAPPVGAATDVVFIQCTMRSNACGSVLVIVCCCGTCVNAYFSQDLALQIEKLIQMCCMCRRLRPAGGAGRMGDV